MDKQEYSERFLISEPCYHNPTILKRCQTENKRIFALYSSLLERVSCLFECKHFQIEQGCFLASGEVTLKTLKQPLTVKI